jgi:phage terminase large subunit
MRYLMTSPNAELVAKLLEVVEAHKQDPKRFIAYRDKPLEFCDEILGVWLWQKQKDILIAARDNKRVAVKSGHGVGKTFAVACLVIWWLYARQGLIITTAPTWKSVEQVLWREIHNLVQKAPVFLPGEKNQTDLKIDNTWYAIGLSTDTPSAFQGRHHPDLLAVVDEAAGVNEQVHLEIGTLATGSRNVIVMIGNPTSNTGTFHDAFKNPDIWKCITISCFDHPNVVTGKDVIPGAVNMDWIEERRRQWGDHHPFWFSRVLGEFPKISNKGVIPLGWIERQTNEDMRVIAIAQAQEEHIPRIGGLDVARYGENQSVLTIREGDAILEQVSWHHASLMETAGLALKAIRDYELAIIVVDASGIGAGVVDRLLEQGAPVYAYNGGHRAFTPGSFTNRRTEMWWYLRERFEKGKIWLPAGCERLTADLVGPEYEISSAGRIKLWSKEYMLEHGFKSPDWADSLVLCFAVDEDPEVELEAPVPPSADPVAWEAVHGGTEVGTDSTGQFPLDF